MPLGKAILHHICLKDRFSHVFYQIYRHRKTWPQSHFCVTVTYVIASVEKWLHLNLTSTLRFSWNLCHEKQISCSWSWRDKCHLTGIKAAGKRERRKCHRGCRVSARWQRGKSVIRSWLPKARCELTPHVSLPLNCVPPFSSSLLERAWL